MLTNGGKPHVCGKIAIHDSGTKDGIHLCSKCNMPVDGLSHHPEEELGTMIGGVIMKHTRAVTGQMWHDIHFTAVRDELLAEILAKFSSLQQKIEEMQRFYNFQGNNEAWNALERVLDLFPKENK